MTTTKKIAGVALLAVLSTSFVAFAETSTVAPTTGAVPTSMVTKEMHASSTGSKTKMNTEEKQAKLDAKKAMMDKRITDKKAAAAKRAAERQTKLDAKKVMMDKKIDDKKAKLESKKSATTTMTGTVTQ